MTVVFKSRFVKILLPVLIVLGVFILTTISYHFGFFNLWQEKITDRFFLKTAPPENIVIIAIDNESINKIGAWPWPRSVFAKLIAKLQSAHKIGLDVNFAEPSRLGVSDDFLLAAAINNSTPTIVLPLTLREDGVISTAPLPIFADNAELGFVNIFPDPDGVVRKTRFTVGTKKSFATILSETTTMPASLFRSFYYGPAQTFPIIPVIDLLEDEVPESFLKDSFVLIGATAPDLHDFVLTPFGHLSGAEAHANFSASLLAQKFFKETTFWPSNLLILIFSLLPAIIIWQAKKFLTLLLYLGGVFVIIQIATMILFVNFWLIPHFYLSFSLILSSAILISWHYMSETAEKRFIRNAFRYYLTPGVIEEIIANPNKLKLGGELKELVIFFSDIRGFTTISEQLTPEALTTFMNRYLTLMTDAIMENHGLVDKYIGDAIMAFWGAPLENRTKVADACRAVKLMTQKLKILNQELRAENLPEIKIGMGLALGAVVVGNMGSEKRFNYTVMGDSVNLASRLEGLTKTYNVTYIVNEDFARAIPDSPDFKTKELDLVTVKGKTKPTKIFELIIPNN